MKYRIKQALAWIGSAIGLLVLVISGVYAEAVVVTYTPATEYEDGTPLPIEQIAETRLYCNDELIVAEPGADAQFDVDLGIGTHVCYGTHVATNGLESVPSESFTQVVLPSVAPNPPSNVRVR